VGFWDRVEKAVNQGLESSREAVGKAKDKARDLGEKGLLRYEMLQLEREAGRKLSQLGVQVYERLGERGQATVSREAVAELLEEISELKQRIEQKEKAIEAVGK
jgi:hypothetical protein